MELSFIYKNSKRRVRTPEILLSERIRTVRLSKNKTQLCVAKIVGVSQGVVSLMEKGDRGISATQLKSFAIALETTTDYLLAFDSDLTEGFKYL